MNRYKDHFPIFSLTLLVGITSCIPEDDDHGIDEELDAPVETSDASMAALSEPSDLGEVHSNEALTPETSGNSLRADFNGDGKADLVIGIPNKTFDGVASGGIAVVYGSAEGLKATEGALDSQVWHQGTGAETTGVGVAEAGDEFGLALAAGDFNGDQYADLAIGAPSDVVNGQNGAGSVTILHGSALGLTSSGQLWNQGTGIGDVAEPNDNFGHSLTTGYFNDDAYADLAIGVAGENIGMAVDAGAVHVIYGSSVGLTAAGNQLLHQGLVGLAEAAEGDDRFGVALATGDFDHDDHDDLAIGVPGENVGKPDTGLVHVLYGSEGGLWPSSSSTRPSPAPQIWHQESTGIEGVAEASDAFGSALAAGDFDHDGFDDIAVGVPGEDVGSTNAAGAVNTIYGSDLGLTDARNQSWHQDTSGVQGEAGTGDSFGEALAVGDFDGDAHDDLAIGSPGENIAGVVDAGVVHVLYGAGSGLSSRGDQLWHRNANGIDGEAEAFDLFASTLSIGDFDGDGAADLVIGLLFEDMGPIDDAGSVNVIYGDREDGLTGKRDQVWNQDRVAVPED
jgi:hypothetical protein